MVVVVVGGGLVDVGADPPSWGCRGCGERGRVEIDMNLYL